MSRVSIKALKAARLYLEMRGYLLKDQRWGRGKHTVDLIAGKDSAVFFISVCYATDLPAMTASEVNQLRSAAASWVEENKLSGKTGLATLALDPGTLAVLGFNQLD